MCGVKTLDELLKTSALPSFATDLTQSEHNNEHRILIPLTDSEVNVTFKLACKKYNNNGF